ncbi:MAG: chemotaxis protein CheW [Granulosicoccus sp.]
MLSTLYKNSDIEMPAITQGNDLAELQDDLPETPEPMVPADSGVVVAINSSVPDPMAPETGKEVSTYGSFSLAGTEFALSAQSIQEVVNEPQDYSPIPLAPAYLLGVFNLRGSIVPVLDLRQVFSLESVAEDKPDLRKVAIVEYGDLCLGLLFDSTGEVFNSNEVEQCLFESRGDTAAEQVIAGVFKMQGGSRIVQILDVHGMLNLEKVPRSKNIAGEQVIRKRGKRRQCISFRIGTACCALDIVAIREIINIEKIENTVLAGQLCLGAIDIRGDTVPIVNFSQLLGYDIEPPSDMQENDSYRVIVMNVQDNLVGLLVDSIENIVSYFDDELIDFPVLVDKKRAMFNGCVPALSDREHAILLKHDEILSADELLEITRGHSQLFNDSKENTIREKRGSLDRTTLLTFSLKHHYGLNIRDVSEVIDYPSDLIETPNMADHICGMANLRGELVAVIDTRKLYCMPPLENDQEQGNKVLIYEKSGVKHGLVVDSVDSIVPFSRSDVVNVPEILFRAFEGDLDKDVKEAIMMKEAEAEETICILDLDAVSRRASV